jgi:long-chain acyl-CoA synthetase
MAKHKGFRDGLSWPELLEHPMVVERIQKEVDAANEQLPCYMQIKYYRILPTPFSIEGGEMTPTMKLKKMVIEEKYKDVLDSMYKEGEI